MRILLIDDDRGLCDLLVEFLAASGFRLDVAHNGPDGLRRALSGEHALAILDVMLPGMNGFDVLRGIRGQSRLPVLMLTAHGEEVDRIVGLEIGADDYLAKPFNPRELVARVNAILRRAGSGSANGVAAPAPDHVVVADVELSPAARRVRCGSREVELTGTEFALLEVLLRAAGRIVSRDELCHTTLGRPLQPFDRRVDMHVSNVRKKLGPAADGGERIRGIRGAGYVYVVPDRAAAPIQ